MHAHATPQDRYRLSMSGTGYIYVKNWDRFQHYKNRRPSWIKLYIDLFNDDEYLDLTPSDRCLLQACWMAAAESGNGRARADQSTLRARSKSPKGSLKRLSDAGFITIRASKKLAEVLAPELEREEERDIPLTPVNGGNGSAPKQTRAERQAHEAAQRHLKAVVACRRVWRNAEDEGEYMPAVRTSLEREYRHDPSIVTEAIGAQ